MPPCDYVTPAKGHQKSKVCGKPEFKGGRCEAHQPPPVVVVVAQPLLTWQPRTDGAAVNATFQTECTDNALRINAICQNGVQAGGMSFTGGKGNFQLLHDTQPHANNAFFYRWEGFVMQVYGVGHHTTDNKHYALTWYDGSTASVDLGKKKIT